MFAGRDDVGSLSCCLAAPVPGGRGAGVHCVPASTGRAHLTLLGGNAAGMAGSAVEAVAALLYTG